MTTLQDVQDAIARGDAAAAEEAAQVSADLQALRQQVADLQAVIDGGGGVTSADLEGLVSSIDALTGNIDAIDPDAPTP